MWKIEKSRNEPSLSPPPPTVLFSHLLDKRFLQLDKQNSALLYNAMGNLRTFDYELNHVLIFVYEQIFNQMYKILVSKWFS